MEDSPELPSDAFRAWRALCRSSGRVRRRQRSCFASWRRWARARRRDRRLLEAASAAGVRARKAALLGRWGEAAVESLPVHAYGLRRFEAVESGATPLRAAYRFAGRRANAAAVSAWLEWKRVTKSNKDAARQKQTSDGTVDKLHLSDRRGRRRQRRLEAQEWMSLEFGPRSEGRNLMVIKWIAKREMHMSVRRKEMEAQLTRDDDILKRTVIPKLLVATPSRPRRPCEDNDGIERTRTRSYDFDFAKTCGSVPPSPVLAACQSPIAGEVHELLSPPRVSVLDNGSAELLRALCTLGDDIVSAKECSTRVPESSAKDSARRAVVSLRASKSFDFDRGGSIEARLSSRRRARRQCLKDIDAHCCACEARHIEDGLHKKVVRDDCSWLQNKKRILSYHDKCIEEANRLIEHQGALLQESRAKQDILKQQLHSCCRSLEHSLEKTFMSMR